LAHEGHLPQEQNLLKVVAVGFVEAGFVEQLFGFLTNSYE
jgi:hypothetical protein